jgi:hypothetical protein
MPAIVVTGIIAVIPCVVSILQRGMQETGRIVLSVGGASKQKIMFGLALMNIILRNWKILRNMNLPGVQGAVRSLFGARVVIRI